MMLTSSNWQEMGMIQQQQMMALATLASCSDMIRLAFHYDLHSLLRAAVASMQSLQIFIYRREGLANTEHIVFYNCLKNLTIQSLHTQESVCKVMAFQNKYSQLEYKIELWTEKKDKLCLQIQNPLISEQCEILIEAYVSTISHYCPSQGLSACQTHCHEP